MSPRPPSDEIERDVATIADATYTLTLDYAGALEPAQAEVDAGRLGFHIST